MCVCSGKNRDSWPRCSASTATSAGLIASCVAKIATPNSMPSLSRLRPGPSRGGCLSGRYFGRQCPRWTVPPVDSAPGGQCSSRQCFSRQCLPWGSKLATRKLSDEGSRVMAAKSYTSEVYGTPLIGDTIGENFDATAARHADRDALIDIPAGKRWTYAELKRDVDALALGLLAEGIVKGDRVGIWSPNRAEWTLVQYATAKIGAILVNINPAYRTSELEFVLNQSGARMLIAARQLKTSDYAAMIAEVAPHVATLEKVILLDSLEWDALLELGRLTDPKALVAIELSADDPINIQYTSGTTGFPKGATLSHHNILNNGYFVGELCNYAADDKICIPVPFYHCFGMVMGNLAATSHGAAMVIPAPVFDPVATLKAVEAEGCTSLYG